MQGKGSDGFRIPRGRVTWTCARYPDRSTGERAEISRIVCEGGRAFTRIGYAPGSTPIAFVDRDGKPIE